MCALFFVWCWKCRTNLLHNRGSLTKTGRRMPHLFVAGEVLYYRWTNTQTVQMVCSRGHGVKLLWSMKIFHLITPVRITAVRPRCLIDRLTWLWLLTCFALWEIITFPLKDKLITHSVFSFLLICSASFSCHVWAGRLFATSMMKIQHRGTGEVTDIQFHTLHLLQ